MAEHLRLLLESRTDDIQVVKLRPNPGKNTTHSRLIRKLEDRIKSDSKVYRAAEMNIHTAAEVFVGTGGITGFAASISRCRADLPVGTAA